MFRIGMYVLGERGLEIVSDMDYNKNGFLVKITTRPATFTEKVLYTIKRRRLSRRIKFEGMK
jgi:hypothetical protein